MKYKIDEIKEDDEFKPYTVTLTIETKAESTHFHDNIMTHIGTVNVHPFYGSIYRAGEGDFTRGEGTIAIAE